MELYDYHNFKQLYFFGSCKNGLKGLIKAIDNYIKTADEKEKALGISISSNIVTRQSIYSKRNNYYNLRNSIIIVLGNCLFDKNKTLFNLLDDYNNKLSSINSHLLFIRGENDNQDLFFNKEINLSNIKVLSDYTVIKVDKYNILTIGGNISIDRSWKKEYGTVISKRLYWENENTEYSQELIDEILNSTHIDAIASISCPTFVSIPTDTYRKEWIYSDDKLKTDIIQQRLTMDNIYHQCLLKENVPKTWVFSNCQSSDDNYVNNILFKSINGTRIFWFTKWYESTSDNDDYESDGINMNFDEELEEYEEMAFGNNAIEN